MNVSPHRGAAKPCRNTLALTVPDAKGVVIACTLLFAGVVSAPAEALAADVPSDAEVLALVHTHCVPCHAAEPTHPAFAKPPARIMLETIEQVRQYAPRILTQVAETRAMPLGNETDMTDEERDRIAAWIKGHQE